MQLTDILPLDHVSCDSLASSKKRVLELISELIAHGDESLNRNDIFDSLLARERLGSTGLGHGIAIPHGRLRESSRTIGALLKLQAGIDYDAMDKQPVDLVFALVVPAESTEEHLQLLAKLAEMFSNQQVVTRLRAAQTPQALLDIISEWQETH